MIFLFYYYLQWKRTNAETIFCINYKTCHFRCQLQELSRSEDSCSKRKLLLRKKYQCKTLLMESSSQFYKSLSKFLTVIKNWKNIFIFNKHKISFFVGKLTQGREFFNFSLNLITNALYIYGSFLTIQKSIRNGIVVPLNNHLNNLLEWTLQNPKPSYIRA